MKKMLNLSLASAFAFACLTGATLAQDNNGNNGDNNNNGGAQGGQVGKTGAGDNNDPTSTSPDCRENTAGSNADCQNGATAQ